MVIFCGYVSLPEGIPGYNNENTIPDLVDASWFIPRIVFVA